MGRERVKVERERGERERVKRERERIEREKEWRKRVGKRMGRECESGARERG